MESLDWVPLPFYPTFLSRAVPLSREIPVDSRVSTGDNWSFHRCQQRRLSASVFTVRVNRLGTALQSAVPSVRPFVSTRYLLNELLASLFTARCTIVQSAVLRSHFVCLSSVSPSVCDLVIIHDHVGWKSWKL